MTFKRLRMTSRFKTLIFLYYNHNLNPNLHHNCNPSPNQILAWLTPTVTLKALDALKHICQSDVIIIDNEGSLFIWETYQNSCRFFVITFLNWKNQNSKKIRLIDLKIGYLIENRISKRTTFSYYKNFGKYPWWTSLSFTWGRVGCMG